VSAELVSDSPQTVLYTIDRKFVWSNGERFSVDDLLERVRDGAVSRSPWADGFHHIASTKVGSHRKTLRIVFASHYASWANMFQGLEYRASAPACDLSEVAQRPSLGPYLLESLTTRRAVLVANPQFRVRSQQFRTVVIEAGTSPSGTNGRPIVDYRTDFSVDDLTWMASFPGRSGKISISQQLIGVTFSKTSRLTSSPEVRQALSLAIDRWATVNRVIGDYTQFTAPAASALITQGQAGYPGSVSSPPYVVASATTTTVPSPSMIGSHQYDCVSCAPEILARHLNVQVSSISSGVSRGTVRLGVVAGRAQIRVAQAVARGWRQLGFATRLIFVTSEVGLSQALTQGLLDAGVTTMSTSNAATTGAAWNGVRRVGSLDFGWRSARCDKAAVSAEADFNASTATQKWLVCDREIAEQFWQRPLFALPYSLQWTNTVVGVAPSNTLAGFVDQVPQWSSLQNAG
jgi:ABC-type transport system substrate-binding protein